MSDHEERRVGPQHMPDGLTLPIHGPDFPRAEPELIEQLSRVSAATAAAGLHGMGVRQSFIQGPVQRLPGTSIIGTAVTLQFMPQREDIASGIGQEHTEKVSALWRVLDEIRPGDVLVVQAYGDRYTGCLGEMLITYLKGRGGVGLVVDGCIRDWPKVRNNRAAAVDGGGHPALRLAGVAVPLGVQRSGGGQPRSGHAGRHRNRRRRRRRDRAAQDGRRPGGGHHRPRRVGGVQPPPARRGRLDQHVLPAE